jgi:hypothetical protein
MTEEGGEKIREQEVTDDLERKPNMGREVKHEGN